VNKLKSTDVYREMRGVVGPWSKANGYKRGKTGVLSYTKTIGDKHLWFWFQTTQSGWEDYSGSAFIVELQLSSDPTLYSLRGSRHRLPRLSTELDLARVRQTQNSVIADLPHPPRDHPILATMGADIAAWYLQQFRPISEPYTTQSDIWFRYHNPQHVRR
jgi:hypothetical protein